MAIWEKKTGTVFLKDHSDTADFLAQIKQLRERAQGQLKEEIEEQIRLAEYGEAGECQIRFELMNSGMDLFVLHDIYLEFGELSAQIDYIVVSRKRVYVIECKNLFGNIEIDRNGSFTRTMTFGRRTIREGLYSPVTQNERHLTVIREIGKSRRTNFFSRRLYEQAFQDYYRSLVVLANPKTVLNDRYAPKEIKNQVYRADQLISAIRKLDAEVKEPDLSEKAMRSIAESLLEKSIPRKNDCVSKYEERVREEEEKAQKEKKQKERICPRCGGVLRIRIARRGNYTGNRFWGCSNYPKCTFLENIPFDNTTERGSST